MRAMPAGAPVGALAPCCFVEVMQDKHKTYVLHIGVMSFVSSYGRPSPAIPLLEEGYSVGPLVRLSVSVRSLSRHVSPFILLGMDKWWSVRFL